MTTTTTERPVPSIRRRPHASSVREFRYTRDDYDALVEAGLFEHTHVELIRGRLIEMPPMSTEHGASAMRGGRVLRAIFPEDRFTVRTALPFLAADDSEPEPDFCVIAGVAESIAGHPSECLLVVEISLSTLAYDRTEKASLYAESGVLDYWIINVADRAIEVHREPTRSADGAWSYASRTIHRPGEACSPLAAPNASIDPAAVLPAAS